MPPADGRWARDEDVTGSGKASLSADSVGRTMEQIGTGVEIVMPALSATSTEKAMSRSTRLLMALGQSRHHDPRRDDRGASPGQHAIALAKKQAPGAEANGRADVADLREIDRAADDLKTEEHREHERAAGDLHGRKHADIEQRLDGEAAHQGRADHQEK